MRGLGTTLLGQLAPVPSFVSENKRHGQRETRYQRTSSTLSLSETRGDQHGRTFGAGLSWRTISLGRSVGHTVLRPLVPPVAAGTQVVSSAPAQTNSKSHKDVPLGGLAVLCVLGTLVQVRVPSETFTTITLGDFLRGDTTFLPFVHVPPDRTVDIPGLRTGKGS